jgi:hypothetical protein
LSLVPEDTGCTVYALQVNGTPLLSPDRLEFNTHPFHLNTLSCTEMTDHHGYVVGTLSYSGHPEFKMADV